MENIAMVAPVMEEIAENAREIFHFKSTALNEYSRQIAELGEKVATANFDLARILGTVSEEQCYKEDGFKSVADYAEATFGIKRSNAYQLAKVGTRFLNSDTMASRLVGGLLPVSCLAEISSMTDEEIETALEDGTIKATSTQRELREVAKNCKESKNTKSTVEKARAINATIVTAGRIVTREFKGTLSVFVAEVLEGEYDFTDCVIKTMVKDKEVEIVTVLSADGDFAKVELKKFTPVKAAPTAKPLNQYTPEEIMAAYEALMRVKSKEDDEEPEEGEEG